MKNNFNLIMENWRFFYDSLLNDILLESKIDDLKKKYPQFVSKIDELVSNGITGVELEWSVKQVDKTDIGQLTLIVDKFKKNKQRLKNKDLNAYKSVEDLRDALDALGSSGGEKERKAKGNAQKLFENESLILIRPLSTKASCYYGFGTKWCISAQEGNRFNEYAKSDAKFYFIIDKIKKEKIAYSIMPVKNIKNITFLKINKDKDTIIGEDIIQRYSSADTRLSQQEVVQTIGSIEKNLQEIMINDYKTGKKAILATEEDAEEIFSDLDQLIKNINSDNKEKIYSLEKNVDSILRDIVGTPIYNSMIPKLKQYASKNIKIARLIGTFIPELRDEVISQIEIARKKSKKFIRATKEFVEQDNFEEALKSFMQAKNILKSVDALPMYAPYGEVEKELVNSSPDKEKLKTLIRRVVTY